MLLGIRFNMFIYTVAFKRGSVYICIYLFIYIYIYLFNCFTALYSVNSVLWFNAFIFNKYAILAFSQKNQKGLIYLSENYLKVMVNSREI